MNIALSQEKLDRIHQRLQRLYGEQSETLLRRFQHLVGRYGVGVNTPPPPDKLWDHRDVVLITYADNIQTQGEAPLQTLRRFAVKNLKGAVTTLHLLPFYPWSSDDGFSVIDYRNVKAEYGGWKDVSLLEQDFDLMFDFVVNHCSSQSKWFRDFMLGIDPGRQYFVTADPKEDLSQVVRPRTSPLLTKYSTRYGDVHVWTTFSADQVDLNWQNPDLLFEFLDILFLYLSKGARILRLDAVAFLWKKAGTSCLHLEETHEVVKLFRDVCSIVSPQTLVLTETNVPHEENLSYLGNGDEAHMVYNFSLPPLLLHSLLRESSRHLTDWAASLQTPPPGCTFFNFTASHDGIGVRPLQGILATEEIDWLAQQVCSKGGQVSYKKNGDGSKSPYELNITYLSALDDPEDPSVGEARFLCSQALALALQGIPAVYIHSLLGSTNDEEGFQKTGINRTLNRKKYDESELNTLLAAPENRQSRIFRKYLQMLRRRAKQKAFDPNAGQVIHDIGDPLFVVERTSVCQTQRIFGIFNLSGKPQVLKNPGTSESLRKVVKWYDILSSRTHSSGKKGISLEPYQALWLVPREE